MAIRSSANPRIAITAGCCQSIRGKIEPNASHSTSVIGYDEREERRRLLHVEQFE